MTSVVFFNDTLYIYIFNFQKFYIWITFAERRRLIEVFRMPSTIHVLLVYYICSMAMEVGFDLLRLRSHFEPNISTKLNVCVAL